LLRNSYIHIPSVSYGTEKKIWDSGIDSWDSFDTSKLNLPKLKKNHLKKFVDLSIESLDKGNYSFFSSLLPRQEHWRCFNDFSKIAYLDIETTGLSKEHDDITMIGVYDGSKVKTFINGKNLGSFKKYISNFPMIVTFNGSCFDLPFISSKFNMKFDQLHIDLRFASKKLGYSGGLKNIEKQCNLKRSDETDGLDGFEAVRLWHRYLKGDDASLKLLTKYNSEDVINLEALGHIVYDGLKEKTF
jgi:hypothetical protein